jgi:hypothetical protein
MHLNNSDTAKEKTSEPELGQRNTSTMKGEKVYKLDRRKNGIHTHTHPRKPQMDEINI